MKSQDILKSNNNVIVSVREGVCDRCGFDVNVF